MYQHDIDSVKNPKFINENFDNIARKMGMKNESVESDDTVIPYMKSLIVQSRAWKYALAVPAVMLALGMSVQKKASNPDVYIWDIGKNIGKDLQTIFSLKSEESTIGRLNSLGNIVKHNLLLPLKDSFKQFWKGTGEGLPGKYIGKATILGTLGLILLANISMLRSTNAKDKKVVDVSAYSLESKDMLRSKNGDE